MGRSAQLRRALVVEDEIMVAMYVEDLLTDLGYEVAGMATALDEALGLAREGEFDFAVLDINHAGQLSFKSRMNCADAASLSCLQADMARRFEATHTLRPFASRSHSLAAT